MARFDQMQRTMQVQVNHLYSDACSWSPLAGGPAIEAMVLLNIPSELQSLNEDERAGWMFHPVGAWLEYAYPDLPGLMDAVRTGSREVVTVKGAQYRINEVVATFDGKTFKAKILPV
jgi:hypothetical protein